MALTSELQQAASAGRDPAGSAGAAPTRAPEIAALLALQRSVAAKARDGAELGSALKAQLKAAGARLEAFGEPRLLPLLRELEQALGAMSGHSGSNASAAVAAGLSLLARSLESATSPSRAREMAAIADLRSVRGAPPPWRNPLVECTPAAPPPAPAAGAIRRGLIPRALAAYRKALIRFLRSDSPQEANRLAGLCARVAEICGEPDEQRRWRAAAGLFTAATASGGTARALVKRLAVKLEQVLRGLSDQAPADDPGRGAMIADLEVLAALLTAPAGQQAASALPVSLKRAALEAELDRLAASPAEPAESLGRIADAYLVAGDYSRWLEAWRLGREAHGEQELRAALARWKAPAPAAAPSLAEARAALRRIEDALGPDSPRADEQPPARISGIPVDEALLQNLDLMAREIRGARSRAEANLGGLKGGLMDMERTIHALRAQLESLEVDAHAGPASKDAPEAGAQARFGALSRGIEELAGLKDALEALTEDTESVLAAQAGEDVELEQGLLKTRMMPVGDCFESLRRSVQAAAAGFGPAATLSARGAGVLMERSQIEALARVLEPLLAACLDQCQGGAGAEVAGSAGLTLELEVSRPRFDVCVDLRYPGGPLPEAALAAFSPNLDPLGALLTRCSGNGDGSALRLLVPGPPEPMDLLLIDLGGARFGLPLDQVTGVARAPAAAEIDGGAVDVDDQRYRLVSVAEALGLESEGGAGSACVLVARGASRLACLVDAVVGRRHMLVRSPGPLLAPNPWVLGAVVDPLAAPALVLDLSALEEKATSAQV